MKALSIILLFLLFGCAPSTQDLIEQAHATGDWSFVNERFEAIEKREAQHSETCPRGTTEWCPSRAEGCRCVNNSNLQTAMSRMRPVPLPRIRRR